MRMTRPRRFEFRPCRDQEQNAKLRYLFQCQRQQFERGRVCPMSILEDDECRLTRGEHVELSKKCRQRDLLALLRGQLGHMVAIAHRQREQVRQSWYDLVHIRAESHQQSLEFGEFFRRLVGSLEARNPLELPYERIERTVRVMGRAEMADSDVWRGFFQPLLERQGNVRLPDTWLSRQYHGAALATCGLVPATQQQIDLLVAS